MNTLHYDNPIQLYAYADPSWYILEQDGVYITMFMFREVESLTKERAEFLAFKADAMIVEETFPNYAALKEHFEKRAANLLHHGKNTAEDL